MIKYRKAILILKFRFVVTMYLDSNEDNCINDRFSFNVRSFNDGMKLAREYYRVLTRTQCKWILYESCHKLFMKATQILYAFCFAQHWVGESNSCVRTF